MEPFPQQDPSEAPDTGLFSTLEQIKDQAQSIGVGLGASTQQLSRSLVELPLTAQQLAAEMPKVFGRMYRAGLRPGDPTRFPVEILELFAQIPGPAKLNLEEMDASEAKSTGLRRGQGTATIGPTMSYRHQANTRAPRH